MSLLLSVPGLIRGPAAPAGSLGEREIEQAEWVAVKRGLPPLIEELEKLGV